MGGSVRLRTLLTLGQDSQLQIVLLFDADGGTCLSPRRSQRDCLAASTLAEPPSAPASDLTSAMRRAEAAYGGHEKRTGQRDANWSDWYAEYMAVEQDGAYVCR